MSKSNSKLKLYSYTGLDAAGRARKGLIFGKTADEIAFFLHEINVQVIDIKKVSQVWLVIKQFFMLLSSRFRITRKVRIAFYRNLGEMLEARFPLNTTLIYILRNTTCLPLKKALYHSYSLVSEGYRLSYAFSFMPQGLISQQELNLIRASEQIGALSEVFKAVADELDERVRIGSGLSASAYSIIGLIIVLFIVSNRLIRDCPYKCVNVNN